MGLALCLLCFLSCQAWFSHPYQIKSNQAAVSLRVSNLWAFCCLEKHENRCGCVASLATSEFFCWSRGTTTNVKSLTACCSTPITSGDVSALNLFFFSSREVTSDISVQCVFNNAGFIVTGFYESSPEGKQMANLECNATAAAKVCFSFFVNRVRMPACVRQDKIVVKCVY